MIKKKNLEWELSGMHPKNDTMYNKLSKVQQLKLVTFLQSLPIHVAKHEAFPKAAKTISSVLLNYGHRSCH